jgi:hypothetical protein
MPIPSTDSHQNHKSDSRNARQERISCHVVTQASSSSQYLVLLFLKICVVMSLVTIFVSFQPLRIESDNNNSNIGIFPEEQNHLIWNDDDNPKRFLAIHIGPSKTGTTAIQEKSANVQLNSDGVIYVGKFGGEPSTKYFQFLKCMMETHEEQHNNSEYSLIRNGDNCWKDFMAKYEDNGTLPSLLDSHEEYSYRDRRNESIANPGPFLLTKKYIESKGHDVVLIATYRRYYEWLSSALLQTCNNRLFFPTTGSLTLWLHQGGRQCFKTWQSANSIIKNDKGFGIFTYANIEETVPEKRSIGFNVKVMNYHDPMHPSAILQNLHCNVLKEYTPNTCQEPMPTLISKGNTTGEILSKGLNIHYYDAIVLEAAQRGFINTTEITRREARNSLIHHHTQVLGKAYTDLPILCPPPQFLDNLLEKSLEFERVMSNDLYSTETVDAAIEANHIEGFNHFMGVNLGYCFADVVRLFENVHSYSQLLEESLVESWGEPRRLSN